MNLDCNAYLQENKYILVNKTIFYLYNIKCIYKDARDVPFTLVTLIRLCQKGIYGFGKDYQQRAVYDLHVLFNFPAEGY